MRSHVVLFVEPRMDFPQVDEAQCVACQGVRHFGGY